MNAGIYREPGKQGGLPLPRKYVMGMTVAVGVVALIAIVLAPSLLMFAARATTGMARAWRVVKEAGVLWSGPVVLAGFLLPIVLAVLGAFVVRGRKVPPTALFGLAAFPLGWGMLGHYLGLRTTFGAISGESVDPEQKIRIMAEGASESMQNDVVSGFVVCGCALVACLAASSAAASIDVTHASRTEKPSRSGLVAAAIAGGLWIVVSLALAILRLRTTGGLVVFPLLSVATIVPFAILAGRGAGVLRNWHDAEESKRMLAAVAVAGLSALLALLSLERGLQSAGLSQALGAISGESVDPSQQARVLAEGVASQHLGTLALALHAVFAVLTFGGAMLPALGNGRHPIGANVIVGVVIGAALLGGGVGVSRARTRMARSVADSVAQSGPGGVTLPTVVGTFSHRDEGPRYDNTRLVISANGTDVEPGAEKCPREVSSYYTSRAPGFSVMADRALTVAGLAAVLKARACGEPELVFFARREHPPDVERKLGGLSLFLGTAAYVSARVTIDPFTTADDALDVRSVADDAIDVDGKRTAFPLPDGAELEHTGGRIERLRFSFRPTDTIERMLRIILSVREAAGYRAQSAKTLVDIGLPPRAPIPPDAAFGGTHAWSPNGVKSPSLRQGAIQVNGRLPPEVIQRIVRQNFGRFRLCYENGLRERPTLQGRVTVKFVIDRQGEVTTAADGGSDLPDKDVVRCVVRGFSNLAFPQPEGGIVTVVYPIIFSPGG